MPEQFGRSLRPAASSCGFPLRMMWISLPHPAWPWLSARATLVGAVSQADVREPLNVMNALGCLDWGARKVL
jgi:hypothetical protein